MDNPRAPIDEDISAVFAAGLDQRAKNDTPLIHKDISLDAPNPFISVKNFGVIGLPPSIPEMKRLRNTVFPHTVEEEKPLGLKTEFPSPASPICLPEPIFVSPETATADSPTWAAFMSRQLDNFLQVFGLEGTFTLSFRGIHVILPDSPLVQDPRDPVPPDAFARMEILPPASFEGGTIKLRVGTQTVSHAFVDHRGPTTSVISWFLSKDLELSCAPVTAGAAVVMSYYIHCDPGTPKPLPPTDSEPVLLAMEGIRTWAAGGIGVVRQPIVIPLGRETEERRPRLDDLSEVDTNKMKLAEAMVDGLGLCVGLATFEREQRGHGFQLQNQVYALTTTTRKVVRILNVISSKGRDVLLEPVVLPEKDTPAGLDSAWSCAVPIPRIAGEDGVDPHALAQRLRCIVIWHPGDEDRIKLGDRYGFFAYRLLPTPKGSREQADFLLSRPDALSIPRDDIIKCLCWATAGWADEQRWLRAVELAQNGLVSFMDAELITSALRSIDTATVRNVIERCLDAQEESSNRWAILDRIHALNRKSSSLRSWVDSQLKLSLRMLKRVDATHVPRLVGLFSRFADANEEIVASLSQTQDSSALEACATAFFDLAAQGTSERRRFREHGSTLLGNLVETDNFGFEPPSDWQTPEAAWSPPNSEKASRLMYLCVAYGCEGHLSDLIRRISAPEFLGAPESPLFQDKYLFFLISCHRTTCDIIPMLNNELVLRDGLAQMRTTIFKLIAGHQDGLTDSIVKAIALILTSAGSVEDFEKTVMPEMSRILVKTPRGPVINLLTQLWILRSASQSELCEQISALVPRLLVLVTADWCCGGGRLLTSSRRTPLPELEPVILLCETCILLDQKDSIPTILDAAIEKGFVGTKMLDKIPEALSKLAVLFRTHGEQRLLADQRILAHFRRAVDLWIEKKHGRNRPPGRLWKDRTPCTKDGCSKCSEIARFLSSKGAWGRSHLIFAFRFGAGDHPHVQCWLKKIPDNVATWDIYGWSGKGKGIRVTLASPHIEFLEWRERKLESRIKFEKLAPTAAEMGKILGDTYEKLLTALDVAQIHRADGRADDMETEDDNSDEEGPAPKKRRVN